MVKPFSSKTFIIISLIILVLGLATLGGLYYFLNFQNSTSKPYSSRGGPLTSAPTSISLDLSSPNDDLLSFNSEVLFSGKTSSNSTVLISSQSQDLIAETKNDGSFSKTVSLVEGANIFKITVFDPTGDQKSVERSIYYSKEKI